MSDDIRSGLRVTYPRSPAGRPIFAAAERLVEVWTRNERALATLKMLEHRGDRARAYLDTPGANAALAEAYLRRARDRRREQLEVLREGRRDAGRILEFLRGMETAAPAASASAPPPADMPTCPAPAAQPLPLRAPADFPPAIAPAATAPRQRRYA
ncbi:hypothetical protein OJF2_39540 [Aquisphaera giovannonii]|uniref:Uncharacterized protein n=1 Tax=Aquisphaera giovannonii TaxID=406548 RepID=A0A5B9W476_9BACT|nr:hypothetical protein [Aquisphaera giovannonii]QEH35402.1 hypothetical protein OJF2_39540 [Aquisphaera giovannonii]